MGWVLRWIARAGLPRARRCGCGLPADQCGASGSRAMRQTDVPRLTIGIEEEFQIVDAEGQLRSHSETLLAAARPRLGEQIKLEMMQSVIEAGTKICADISEAREEIGTLRGTLAALLRPAGLRLASAGTHPFSHWQEQQVTGQERYKILEEELQD
ncbi:MAG: hypothetical protein E6I64_02800, partial [Chloroflexi bacterium]